jgi:5'-nucleotidase
MENSIALFDMDGTLCDYMGAQENFPGTKRELVKAMKTVEWWATLPRFKLGFDIWGLAKELGYARMLLTKGPRRIPNAWTGKKLWVDTNLGRETGLTITHDKGLFYGRVLVDDWPKYVTAWIKHRPRGLAIMPASTVNEGYVHPQVIRYDGTNYDQVKIALHKALKTAAHGT